jgi:hypothetical protein
VREMDGLIRDAVGSILERVASHDHIRGEETSLLSVWLTFRGGEPLEVSCANTGGLGVEPVPQGTGGDLGEAGRTEVTDASGAPPFSEVVGRTLVGVEEITDQGEAVGMALEFEGVKSPLVLLNWGDDFWAGLEVPAFVSQ